MGLMRGSRISLPGRLPFVVLVFLLSCFLLLLPRTQAQSCSSVGSVDALVGENGLCNCKAGWDGPSCDVCTTNEVCEAISSDNQCRRETFIVVENKNAWCKTSGDAVNNLLKGIGE